MKDDLNFKAISKYVLIDLAREPVGLKSGIVLPQQSAKADAIKLDQDEAYRVVEIADATAAEYGVEKGDFVYLSPGTMPLTKFEGETIYALIDSFEICGIAPNGFNREEHEAKKKKREVELEAYAKKTRDAARMKIIGSEGAISSDKDLGAT